MSLDQRREELFGAAEKFVAGGKGTDVQRALCDAASAYAKERQASTPRGQQQNGAKHVIPFGRTKGTPIGEAETKDLNYILKVKREGLEDPEKARYRAADLELIAAIEQELGTR